MVIPAALCSCIFPETRHIASNSISHANRRYIGDLVNDLLIMIKILGKLVWKLPDKLLCNPLDVGRSDFSQRLTVSVSKIQAIYICFVCMTRAMEATLATHLFSVSDSESLHPNHPGVRPSSPVFRSCTPLRGMVL